MVEEMLRRRFLSPTTARNEASWAPVLAVVGRMGAPTRVSLKAIFIHNMPGTNLYSFVVCGVKWDGRWGVRVFGSTSVRKPFTMLPRPVRRGKC